MVNIKKCTKKDYEQLSCFLELNEFNFNVYYTNNDVNDNVKPFNDTFNHFLIYNDEDCVGYFKTYYANLIINNIELKCGGISKLLFINTLQHDILDECISKITNTLESEGYNLSLSNKGDYNYRKFGYNPIGSIKNFILPKVNMTKLIGVSRDYAIKHANLEDIELLNEFYVKNLYRINRKEKDWYYLLQHSKYNYYICTNGEEISYLAYCPTNKNIVELHGDINCLCHTFKYIYELFNVSEINVQYNDLDFNITQLLYKYCKDCNISSIANMKIFNISETFEKLTGLLEQQGYTFDNLLEDDKKELCNRILGFQYLPLNKFQFVNPINVQFSIANLK